VKLLLVDDHAIVREGLKSLLTSMFEAIEVGEAADAAQALELARKSHWDCAVVDIVMPGQTGLELVKELKRLRPRLPVLILSVFPEEQYAVRLLRAGASGYLNKESAPEQLTSAIRIVLSGGKYVSPKMASHIATDISLSSKRTPHEALSDREFTVMRLMAAGVSGKEIARQISISNKTVSTYRSRILKKLELRNNSQLVAYAVRNNLFQ
jgi:DNA-binding NarL/FixJ family response regulator